VSAKNCAFKPHGAIFHLRGEGESTITVYQCSGVCADRAAFRLDDQASCRLAIDFSIFSRPGSIVNPD